MRVILSLILLFSLNAFSQENWEDSQRSASASKLAQCPKYKPEFSALLVKVADFSAQLKANPKCTGLQQNLSNLTLLLNQERRDNVQDILEKMEEIPDRMTPEELNALSSYSEDVANSLLGVFEMLNTNPNCVEDNEKVGLLQSLSGIAKQVSGVASEIAGPTGIPISGVASTIAGILSGIGQFLDRGEYDFTKKEYRELYRTNLCTYHDIRKEIDRLSQSETRIQSLERTIGYLDEKIERYSRNCPECAPITEKFEVSKYISKRMGIIQIHIKAIEKSSSSIVEKCERLGRLVHHTSIELREVNQIINDNPVIMSHNQDYYDDMKVWYKSILRNNQHVLEPSACFKDIPNRKDPYFNEKDYEISLAAVKRYLQSAKNLYELDSQDFAKIEIDPLFESNLIGTHFHNAYRSRLWVVDEVRKLRKLEGTGTASARMELEADQYHLDANLIEYLAPKFIEWHGKKTASKVDWLDEQLSDLRAKTNKKLGLARNTSYEQIIEHLMTGEYNGVTYNLYSNLSKYYRGYDKGRNADISVSDYCEFFRKSGLYVDTVYEVCNKYEDSKTSLQLRDFEEQMDLFKTYLNWARTKEGLNIEADWYDLLNIKIENSSNIDESEYFKRKPVN